MNLPLPPVPANTLKSNITYGKLQSYSFEEVSKWVDLLRKELLKLWDVDGLPPHLGMDKEKIIKRFSKLNDYPIEDLFYTDELYPDYVGFIKNFTKMSTHFLLFCLYHTNKVIND